MEDREISAQAKRPALVIFDCDGVLVDSEPIFNQVLWRYLKAAGAQLSYHETAARFTGKHRDDVTRYMRDTHVPIPSDWPDGFYNKALAALDAAVLPIEGVGPVIERLTTARIPICVASNGSRAKMEITLRRTGLLASFGDRYYSAYDIGRSKPAPDVFLHAAKANGADPADCVVIEDSVSGMAAAGAAVMLCFAYQPMAGGADAAHFGATPFVSMAQLPALLGLP